MDKIRIVSDGMASGTKVMLGDKELPGVTSIEIKDIIPHTTVTAKIEFNEVGLDLAASANKGVMDVVDGGEIVKRPIASTDIMMGSDGTEYEGMKRPMLSPSEYAIYYADGRPPVIVSKLE